MKLTDYNKLLRYATYTVVNPQDAEEMVQNAWLAAALNDKLDHMGYMFSCVKNSAKMLFRTRDIVRRGHKDILYRSLNNYDNYVTERYDVRVCFDRLKPRQRAVVALLAVNPDATQRELAQLSNKGFTTIKHHLNVAREVFKDAI